MGVTLPALRFEAEAFQLGGEKIHGRQSAGEAFLRAALAVPGLEEVCGYGPVSPSVQAFARAVQQAAPGVDAKWIPPLGLEQLGQIGAMHTPEPVLMEYANTRLAVGSNAWSLTGITHTISTRAVMQQLEAYSSAPLMEWDGLICTSDAVKASVVEIIDAQEEYLVWRFPGSKPPPRLQLPVIPLGVHCADFSFTDGLREEARRALGLGIGDVAYLFAGRLSFHAKAHPFPMYLALEEAAKRTGKRIALIQCGWFANEHIRKAFDDGAATFAPSVRHIWLDGRQADQRARAWAAGDVFMSLSDNVQETFGLTPLEAMAAGMPVIVTDWDGYRQTVQHGVCGYMIPTFAPTAGTGQIYADEHAAGLIDYDTYLSHTARHVSVDLAALFDAAAVLAQEAGKRRSLGEAGRRIAREQFDWSVIMRRYLAFWDELGAIRGAVSPDDPRCRPRISAARLDPYRVFGNYPTRQVGPDAVLRTRTGGGDFRALLADRLFGVGRDKLPPDETLAEIVAAIGSGATVAQAGNAARIGTDAAILLATLLLKLGVLEFAG
ncbi:MAG: glycosyltransferase family 4 protein [Novosphingobium sp.]